MSRINVDYNFVNKLKDAFSIASPTDSKTQPFVVLRNDNDNRYIFSSCQHEVVGRFRFDNEVEGDIENEILPKKLCDFLSSYLANFPENVRLEINDKTDVYINNKKVLSLNKTEAPTETHKFSNDIKDVCKVDFDIKSKLSDFSCYAGEEEEGRLAGIAGVLIKTEKDSIQLVATDGRRMIRYKKPTECELEIEKVLLPRIVRKISRFLGNDVKIGTETGFVYFESGDVTLRCSTLVKKYPTETVLRLLTKLGERQAKFNRKETYDATYRTTFTSENFRTAMSLKDNVMTLSSTKSELGVSEIEIPCRYNKPPITINFDNRFLMDCLNSCESEFITARFNENTPVYFEDGNLQILVMPLTD